MSKRTRISCVIFLTLATIAGEWGLAQAFASDESYIQLPQTSDDLAQQTPLENLTTDGQLKPITDWFSLRSTLAETGVAFEMSTTQFYQGVASGGLEQQFQYGGRNDYFAMIDSAKLGLWQGGMFTLHGESRYGESANTLTGALAPVNVMLSLPQPNGSVTGLTAAKLQQALSDNLVVYAGKINTLDDFKQPFTSAGPLQGFQNSALVYNPVYARTIPYSTYGAGFICTASDERTIEFTLFDTNNTPTTTGLNTLFNNGVTLFAQGLAPTFFFDRPGHQGISGTYSSGTYSDLTPTAFLDPSEGLALFATPVRGSWSLAYNFDQALGVTADKSGRTWGVFGHLGLADNNPNPVRWFASSGVSGASPLPNRKTDTFGIACFYIGVSDSLKSTRSRLVNLRDEYGIELYYNVNVTSRFQITPDMQVITPFRERSVASLLIGLRAKIDF